MYIQVHKLAFLKFIAFVSLKNRTGLTDLRFILVSARRIKITLNPSELFLICRCCKILEDNIYDFLASDSPNIPKELMDFLLTCEIYLDYTDLCMLILNRIDPTTKLNLTKQRNPSKPSNHTKSPPTTKSKRPRRTTCYYNPKKIRVR